MNSFYNYSLRELEQNTKPKYIAKQLYNWAYKKYTTNYQDMTNISPKEISNLKEKYTLDTLSIADVKISLDKTTKFLFELKDKYIIESVALLMAEKKKDKTGQKIIKSEQITFCISTQVGCKMACSFCKTGEGGWSRDLSVGEIVAQVVRMKEYLKLSENKNVNIVYMGMGEPLDNFENLTKAMDIIADSYGLDIAHRRQTVSTSGLTPNILKLGELDTGVQLAISLHAVCDSMRDELVPLNKAYNIQSIINAVKKFPVDTRKKILFEYLVIKDKNDNINDAKKLCDILQGINAKVNLIYFNPYPGSRYERPTDKSMEVFKLYINKKGIFCSIRKSKGLDIMAACGQLAGEKIDNPII
ncbi:MAG: 23S rRNA (adenine(2503)-C(2))-methyltransferase RlmN [Epsilonproteobacteria bacterium]|nr:MAG: 23S rRNA (adenine(2503)-C(2))-methyltransferase RlmN [Campylobacterota bacterium]